MTQRASRNEGGRNSDQPATRRELEDARRVAIEKMADAFKELYGPALKELERA